MIFDKLEKLGIRERAALVVAVVALLAVLGDRLVVQAFDDALEAVHTRHETQRKRLNYSRVVMERDEDVSAAYREVADLVDEGTAPAVDIDKMKGEIDDLARKSGLVLVSMKHREPRSERHYDVYAVDIGGFEGTMNNLLRFLNAVQRNDAPGLLRVDNLSVTDGREEGTIRGSMTITKVLTSAA